ncbi:MAG TPA: tetratricopeptide repeat protein [Bacteroidia bacterium]|nr:tetratricopeptide repeat protein [Bacteroidia bacterium]
MTFSQSDPYTDSLSKIFLKQASDSNKIIALNDAAGQLIKKNILKATEFANEAYKLSVKLNYKKGRAKALGNLGMINGYKGDFEIAQSYYEKSLQLRDSIGDKLGVGKMLNNIGNLWLRRDFLPKALGYFQKADVIFEKTDSSLHAVLLRNIGSVYSAQKNFKDALINFNKAFRISNALGNETEVGALYTEFAVVAYYERKFDSSAFFHREALKIQEKYGNVSGMANSYNSLGIILAETGDYKRSIEYRQKSLAIAIELGNTEQEVFTLQGLADVYNLSGDFIQAQRYAEEALEKSKQLGILSAKSDAYLTLSRIAFSRGQFKEAYLNHIKYADIRDSVAGESIQKEMAEMKTKYETDKKEKENKLLTTQKELNEQTIKQQRTFSYFIIGGLMLTMALAFFIFRSYRIKRKANIELIQKNELIDKQKKEVETKNKLVEAQKELIEEKNKDIIDSITYARRIQTSLLPTEKYITKSLNNLKNKR